MTRPCDQLVGERREQVPIPLLARSSEGASGNPTAESEMIGQARLYVQTRRYITEALAEGHLGKRERKKMVPRENRRRPSASSCWAANRRNSQCGTRSST